MINSRNITLRRHSRGSSGPTSRPRLAAVAQGKPACGGTPQKSGISIRRSRGFTLFEMVIAVSIFALMGVMAFGGLSETTSRGQSVGSANNRLADLQFAVVYFARDWTQVSQRKIRNQFGDEESNIVLGEDVITFTRGGWSNLLGQKRSSLQRVQYQVVRNQLIRRHWASLDQGIGEQPISQVLLDDIESIEIVFQNALGQPIPEWPLTGTAGNGDPIVLAVKFDLPDMGEVVRLLEIPRGVL